MSGTVIKLIPGFILMKHSKVPHNRNLSLLNPLYISSISVLVNKAYWYLHCKYCPNIFTFVNIVHWPRFADSAKIFVYLFELGFCWYCV